MNRPRLTDRVIRGILTLEARGGALREEWISGGGSAASWDDAEAADQWARLMREWRELERERKNTAELSDEERATLRGGAK